MFFSKKFFQIFSKKVLTLFLNYVILIMSKGKRNPQDHGVLSPLSAEPQSAKCVRLLRVRKTVTRVTNK